MTERHFRSCTLCEAMCGIVIETEKGQITSIRGDEADAFSRGHICPKAVALKDLHEDPERLRRPVKRVGAEWVEISWREAFDHAERGRKTVQSQSGLSDTDMYAGTPRVPRPGG